jgi:hypothetical protein
LDPPADNRQKIDIVSPDLRLALREWSAMGLRSGWAALSPLLEKNAVEARTKSRLTILVAIQSVGLCEKFHKVSADFSEKNHHQNNPRPG